MLSKLFAFTICCLFWATPLPAAETITLVADQWAPFNIVPKTQHQGYMVDIAQEIFSAHNITVIYQVVPWTRALEGAKTGAYTAVVGPTHSEAPYLIFPKEELAHNHISFWVKKGSKWRFRGQKTLDSVSLGVVESYDYIEWLNQYIRNNRDNSNKVQLVSGDKPMLMNLQKLVAGRIGAVADNDAVIQYYANELKISDKIEPAGYDKKSSLCYIAFSPANPRSREYAVILSEGIIKMRKSGRLQQILAAYGLKDWKP